MDAKIEQWQEVISQWRESGQTQKEFCRTRDIKLSTLHYWMKRVKKASGGEAALPELVRITPPATSGTSTEIIIEIDRRFRILVPDGISSARLRETLAAFA
jgi:transposase-like protein